MRNGTFSLFTADNRAAGANNTRAYDVGSSNSNNGDSSSTPGSDNSRSNSSSSMTGGSSSSSSGGWLMGKGKRVEDDSTVWSTEVQRAVMRCLRANGQWEQLEEVWDELEVWSHQQSILSTQQQVNSTAYSRSRSRDGTYFMVYFESGQGNNVQHVPHAMQAQCFLRLLHPSQPSEVVRLVVARTCRLISTQQDPDLADLVLQGPKGEFVGPSCCAVLLDLVQCPLTLVQRTEQHGSGMRTINMYIPIQFRSGAAGLRVQRRSQGDGDSGQQQHKRNRPGSNTGL